jgi:hypothetical protein
LVNRKRSTRISMNSGNPNRRKNGLGRFSRRQLRDQEFFPDEVQRKILGVAATSETPVSMSEWKVNAEPLVIIKKIFNRK